MMPIINPFNDYFGAPGTVKRYLHDRKLLRMMLDDFIKSVILWPLLFIPWGHNIEYLIHGLLFDRFTLREVLKDLKPFGKSSLTGKWWFDDWSLLPYHWFLFVRPFSTFQKLIWPLFLTVYRTRKENM